MPEAVRVRLLGGFQVSVGSRTIEESRWRLRKAASLVKLLALEPGHCLHRERMMDLLWPDLDSKAAANNLRYTLHHARHILEPTPAATSRYLPLEGEQLTFYPNGPLWVDVEAFEEAAATTRRSREPSAYRAAIDLYTGDLLPEDLYEHWVQERREGLRRLYLSLLLDLAGVYEGRREFGLAIEALGRVVEKEPSHEGAHVSLMRLYASCGQRERAVEQYGRLEEILFKELGKEPKEVSRHLYEEIAAGKFPGARPLPIDSRLEEASGESRHNLPVPRTSFVGREREVVEVKRMLAMTRLLTLTGVGGSGKTRLALEVARDLVGAYPDGVWLVELASLSEPELVPQAVAKMLGVREQPGRPLTYTLRDYLRTRNLLLVLDNCEHLVDAVTCLVETLLDSCPHLRVLATSREALRIAGELVWRVPSLSVPEPRHLSTVENLMGFESVQLFVERARYHQPAFVLVPQSIRAVAEICWQLDGIPLAMELAAALIGVMSVEQIAARLKDSLDLLTGGSRTAAPRQQTLRDTLDWSHDLLGEPERRLFRRLSAFAGGWTLEAAEAVGQGDGIEENDVLDLLSRLVYKSLVVVEASGDSALRYRMLEPIRQYGRERLEESGEAELVRRRHAAWFLELAEEAEPKLKGPEQESWLGRLEKEHDNLRAALSWAFERGKVELGLRLSGALGEFWYMLGHLSEGRRWLESALTKGDNPPVPARAKVLAGAGYIAWEQGDYERSVALSEESLALSRRLGDKAGIATALYTLGWAAVFRNDLKRASSLIEEAITLQRASGDMVGAIRSLLILGLVALARHDYERAIALHEEGLSSARKLGDGFAIVLSLALGQAAFLGRGDYRRVRMLLEEGLKLSRQLRMMHLPAANRHLSASLAGAQAQPVRAARLWGAAEVLREAIGTILSPWERHIYGPYIDAARAGLDETAWEAAWAEGKAMTLEEAIEYALSEEEPTPPTTPVPEQPRVSSSTGRPLTLREEEVAVLVARGFTNPQISCKLSVSERTVDAHVRKILKKLGFDSRTQVAAWVAQRGLLL